MANVKVIADKQTERQTDQQTNKQTGQKLYAPDLTMRGHNYVPYLNIQENSLIKIQPVRLYIIEEGGIDGNRLLEFTNFCSQFT